jgi:hypothetical protein
MLTSSRHHLTLALVLSVLLSLVLALSTGAQTANAEPRSVQPFQVVTAPGDCTGARIISIEPTRGVRYYYHGHRLQFPTETLPFDRWGRIELRARPAAGYDLVTSADTVTAANGCFTDLQTQDPDFSDHNQRLDYLGVCAGGQQTYVDVALTFLPDKPARASWRLVTRSGRQLAAATLPNVAVTGRISIPLPRQLKLGSYVVEFRSSLSPATLFPASVRFTYRNCVVPVQLTCNTVKFFNPATNGRTTVIIDQWTGEDWDGVIMNIPAGTERLFRSRHDSVSWSAWIPAGGRPVPAGGAVLDFPACSHLSGVKPKISGHAVVGGDLSYTTVWPSRTEELWAPDLVILTYRWYRGKHRIAGATDYDYTPRKADVGHRIVLKVTGHKPGYPKLTLASKPTAKVRSAG